MNHDQNDARNAFQNATGTDSERSYAGARACEPLLSSEELTPSLSDAQTRGRAVQQTMTSRIRGIPQAAALTRLIADLRPAWDIAEVYAWALNDGRPWDVVVRAGVAGACDWHVLHPAGLRHVGPQLGREYDERPTPTPPTPGEHRRFLADLEARDCGHGDLPERCPMCRRNHGLTQESA